MTTFATWLLDWIKNEPRRLWCAFDSALDGLKATFVGQAAFRLELIIAAVLIPKILHTHHYGLPKKAVLIGAIVLVLVVELLNTAVEAVVDRISRERHPLAKLAKDAAAAAVLVAILNVALLWWVIG